MEVAPWTYNNMMYMYHADMWEYYKRLPLVWEKNMRREAHYHEEMAIFYLCELDAIVIHRKNMNLNVNCQKDNCNGS